ncbi:MAG: hypothetical protein H6834_11715 [Planctomycetes bacterium]|nr:hypothetical protein [Planctomycetota bacterium]
MAHQRKGRRRNKSLQGPNHGARPTRKVKKPLGQTARERRERYRKTGR